MEEEQKKSNRPAPYVRNTLQLASERHMLSKLALANPGMNSEQLALLLGERLGRRVAPRTVRADLVFLRKDWLKNTKQNFNIVQSKEFERITVLEQELWDAWRASRKPKIKQTVEELAMQLSEDDITGKIKQMAEDITGEELAMDLFRDIVSDAIEKSISNSETAEMFVNKIITITEETPGDVRFIRMIHEVQQERRKMQGVYAPELRQLDVRRVEMQGYTGGWSPSDWLEDSPTSSDIVDMDEEGNLLESG